MSGVETTEEVRETEQTDRTEFEMMELEPSIPTGNLNSALNDIDVDETPIDVNQGQTTVLAAQPELAGAGEATLAVAESLDDLRLSPADSVERVGGGSNSNDDASLGDPSPTPEDNCSHGNVDINEVTSHANTTCTAATLSEANAASSSAMSSDKEAVQGKSGGAKTKRKEDKAIEHILKALNSLETTEEKLAALCKKYADLHEEHRVLQTTCKQSQKKLQVTAREKDQLQSEHNKAVMAKGKLESLCRELQKHNKLIKEESIARAREEEERRKEVSSKFQSTIGEIQAQMQDNHERNIKLKEENMELGQKLKKLVDQYGAREEHIDKLMKHRDLETQLHEAKLQQAQVLLQKEQEQNKAERELVLHKMAESQKKSELHEAQEKQLRAQLAMYTEKYEEFQTTLNKSNEVFGKFKTEMDKMTKRIKKLEKETMMWRGKWESSNKALLEMAEEKQKHDKEKATFRVKIERLESLCRALQAERRGKVPDGDIPEVALEPASIRTEKSFDPTKTPPNTPDAPSRTSPETVQGAAQGQGNGHAESAVDQLENSQVLDHLASSEPAMMDGTMDGTIDGTTDSTTDGDDVVIDTSQSDDSSGGAAAQQSQPDVTMPDIQSNDTAAAPANQSELLPQVDDQAN